MKKTIITLLAALLLLPCMVLAQRIDMDEAHLAFEYPEDWLVVSPQLCGVYAPLLEGLSIDAQRLAEDMEAQGIWSRAYDDDASQWLSVLTMADDTSAEIYDIERASQDDRKRIKNRAQNNGLWETTGYRMQDTEWQIEGGVYWLRGHYIRTSGDQTIGRGLRYMTIRNGQYVMIDWQIGNARFGNADLKAFRGRIRDLTITESVPEPTRTVKLTASIPQETISQTICITGQTEAGAGLIASTAEGEVLSVGGTGKGGAFELNVELPGEGTFDLVLTATLEGRSDATMTGRVTFSAKTLPLTLVGAQEDSVTTVTQDSTTISGTTLENAQIQLVTPFGMTKKRADKNGAFSFDVTTEDAGEYKYTLIIDKSGFTQRRIFFTLRRETTEAQEKQKVRETAESVSYKNLQKCRDEDQGKTMRIYGPVTEVSKAGDITYIRMLYNRDGNGQWYNTVVIVAEEAVSVRVGDMLTAVVTVDGVYVESNSDGSDVNVPKLNLVFVDKVE